MTWVDSDKRHTPLQGNGEHRTVTIAEYLVVTARVIYQTSSTGQRPWLFSRALIYSILRVAHAQYSHRRRARLCVGISFSLRPEFNVISATCLSFVRIFAESCLLSSLSSSKIVQSLNGATLVFDLIDSQLSRRTSLQKNHGETV